jgi:hypothetical protein
MVDPPDDDDLTRDLRALGGWLSTPTPPDVRAAVRDRLADTGARRPVRARRRRRWVAVAVAVAVALALAIAPPGRAAVAGAVTGLLRFAGIAVRQAPAGHPSTPARPLPSLRSAGLDEARARAHFPVRVPARLGLPEGVLVADPGPDGAPRLVSLLYRGGTIRLDAFDGTLDLGFEKQVSPTGLRYVTVGGAGALWFPTPHVLSYVDRQGIRHEETARLSAATLVWADGNVTYRLEGPLTSDEAVAVAESLS